MDLMCVNVFTLSIFNLYSTSLSFNNTLLYLALIIHIPIYALLYKFCLRCVWLLLLYELAIDSPCVTAYVGVSYVIDDYEILT